MGSQQRPKKLDGEQLWEFALRALGRRAQSASEIRQRLIRRAACANDVPAVMARLREYGLADDQRFSEDFANSRLQDRGFGRRRVLRDLKSKRVPDNVATAAVESAYAGTDEQELVRQFLARKYRTQNLGELLKDPRQVASVFRRLQTAGFAASPSLNVLRSYSKAPPDEWPEGDDLEDEPRPE